MSGPRSLDYGPLFTLLDRMGLDSDDWQQAFADIRVIERTALERMRAK